jgi:predicted membrane-bound spermidine synthase
VWPKGADAWKATGWSWVAAFQTATLAIWCHYFFDHLWWHGIMLAICLAAGMGLGRLLRRSYASIPSTLVTGTLLVVAVFASYFLYHGRPFTGYFVPVVCIIQMVSGALLGCSNFSIRQQPLPWLISIALLLFFQPFLLYIIDALWVLAILYILLINYRMRWVFPVLLFLSIVSIKSWHYSDLRLFSDQKFFEDKLVGQWETGKQTLDITFWKGGFFVFQDNRKSFSAFDAALYYEPMAHVPLAFTEQAERILILGGENGLLARELLKQPEIHQIDVLPYDRNYLNISRDEPIWHEIHQQVWQEEKVNVLEGSAGNPENITSTYDLILADLPDPVDTAVSRLYTKMYYQKLLSQLNRNGLFVSQAGAYEKQCRMHQSIKKTLKSLGFSIRIFHQQVPTIDHWSWVMGRKDTIPDAPPFFHQPPENSRWITKDAFPLLLNAGLLSPDCMDVEINTLKNPVIIRYATPANP